MVPHNWDSAPRCVCGPNFISEAVLIGESPNFSAASLKVGLGISRTRTNADYQWKKSLQCI